MDKWIALVEWLYVALNYYMQMYVMSTLEAIVLTGIVGN